MVLDTNLLVLFIVGNIDPSRIGGRRLEAFSQSDIVVLNEIVQRFRTHVSTPNILTEASNLIGSGKQQLVRNGCSALGRYIASLDEVYIPSKSVLRHPFFADLGLADAALIELAKKGDTVLTADGPLFGQLSNRGLSAKNFWHQVATK